MIFAVDTNVLLDILYAREAHHEQSKSVMEEASEDGFFIISPEVYAELIAAFDERYENPREEANQFLEEENINVRDHTRQSLAVSGVKWNDYGASGTVECPSCGQDQTFTCENCSEPVTWRNHMITDFLIGSHAEEHADRLITRDKGYFDVPVHYPSN